MIIIFLEVNSTSHTSEYVAREPIIFVLDTVYRPNFIILSRRVLKD